jgi:Fur family ferric uptake transcriptional regulator
METIVIDKTLRIHHIKPTNIRRSVFMILQEKNYALSQAEIAIELSDSFDRVTIYRTLNKFLENGLIHKVVDEQSVKYAFCNGDNCEINMHYDEHVHFKCSKCGHIFCLDAISITTPKLPSGFQTDYFQLTAEGICKDCSTP